MYPIFEHRVAPSTDPMFAQRALFGPSSSGSETRVNTFESSISIIDDRLAVVQLESSLGSHLLHCAFDPPTQHEIRVDPVLSPIQYSRTFRTLGSAFSPM